MESNGEFGGVVALAFSSAETHFRPGDEITPALASSWPIANRNALARQGRVRWYQAPAAPTEAAPRTRKSAA